MNYIKADFEGSFINRMALLKEKSYKLQIITSFLTSEYPLETINDPRLSYILNLRHIAKKGTDLSSSGRIYSGIERKHAAKTVIDEFLTEKHVDEIIEKINKTLEIKYIKKPLTIYLVRRIKDYKSMPGLNYLLHMYLTELELRLNKRIREIYPRSNINFNSKKTLLLLVKTKRTSCDALGRLCMQPIFDTNNFNDGDKVFLVDDHIQAASFILSSWVSLENRGCEILGVASLTAHPYSLNLSNNRELVSELNNIVKRLNSIDYIEKTNRLDIKLKKIGLTKDKMTNFELLSLIAMLLDKNDFQYFDNILSKINTEKTRTIEDGRYDSLLLTLEQEALTIDQICDSIDERIKARTTTPELLIRMPEIIYNIYPTYSLELKLQNTEYPMTKDSINEFLELSKNNSIEQNIQILMKKSKQVAEILGINRTPKVFYAKNEEKAKYIVSIVDNKFVYRNNTPVDSLNIFVDLFNRTPNEDDSFLENNGYEMNYSRRKGKSINSCILIDKEKKLFIFPYRAGTIHHTFITRGEGVIFAGTAQLNNGKMKFLNDNSGHYKPHPSSLLIFANYIKNILKNNINKLFKDDFIVDIFDSSAHRNILNNEKEIIKKEFLKIIEKSEL